MKKNVFYSILIASIPLCGYAQYDDMYFVPKKEKKPRAQQVQSVSSEPAGERTVDYSFNLPSDEVTMGNTRDVDEYNRRPVPYTIGTPDTVAVAEDGSAYAEPEETEPSDYQYSRRILRFYTPTVGIAVSSPLYWDLRYGPNSIYWDVYDDGFYAYAYPSVWNSWYYSPYYSWGWPYYHHWGWDGYYHPWWGGGCGWHHPWWGGPGHGGPGWQGRPVNRPSTMYRENSALARGGSRSTYGRAGLGTGRGAAGRSAVTSQLSGSGRQIGRRTNATTSTQTVPRRANNTSRGRSAVPQTTTRSSSGTSSWSGSRSGGGSPMRSSGFSSGRSGGFSSGRSGGRMPARSGGRR